MDFKPTQPIYLQIAEMLINDIALGRYPGKERFPSVREMASDLAVNPNTVARAYEELQSKFVIEMQRGVGYFVQEDAQIRIQVSRKNEFYATTLPEIVKTIIKLDIPIQTVVDLYNQTVGTVK